MERSPEGIALSTASMQRVDRCLEYWSENRRAFDSNEAIIICSGGYGLFAAGIEAPEDGSREANLMADEMIRAGVPHRILELETESYSTVTNWTESMQRGFIDPASYDATHRLGVVTHPSHFKRARDSARRLGLPKSALQKILVANHSDFWREKPIRAAYWLGSIGAYGEEELIKRDRMVAKALTLGRRTKEL